MRVRQLSTDRYTLELPAPEADYTPLADRDELSALVRRLWTWGRTPLLALVPGDGSWCGGCESYRTFWVPAEAEASGDIVWRTAGRGTFVVLPTEQDLFLFLLSCPDVSRVALLWPKIDPVKSLTRLAQGDDWRAAVEAYARLSQQGSLIELEEIP